MNDHELAELRRLVRQQDERLLRLENQLRGVGRSRTGFSAGPGVNVIGQDTEIDGDLTVSGAIHGSVPWAQVTGKPEIDAANINWASDATIVGWSSRTSTFIRYACIGPMVFVSFYITGTSNSTNTSFTLPFNVTGMTIRPLCRIRDNGNYALGSVYLFGDTATFYPTVSGGDWTASGTKEIAGELFYWKA